MRQPDPDSYSVSDTVADTDRDGRFLIYVPEENFYSIQVS
jgi:hypothetical protein